MSLATQRRQVARVKLTARAHTRARTQRDAAIVAAREAGLPLRTIAEAAGITHRTVTQILARLTA
jgi:DNA-binding NarL/FixJ family response regulator